MVRPSGQGTSYVKIETNPVTTQLVGLREHEEDQRLLMENKHLTMESESHLNRLNILQSYLK